ncbi:MAG: hypothetical protein ACK5OB_06090, partial [Pirellula sp.]
MAATNIPWERRGIVLSYFAILLMAGLLILVNVLPQFMAAGYKDVIPWMSLSSKAQTWAYPILQILLILGVGLTATATRGSKTTAWGIALLLFTTLVNLWPTVVYLGDLPSSWLNGTGINIGYRPVVPFTQAWLFTGMLAQLATRLVSLRLSDSSNIQDADTVDKLGWKRASAGLRLLLILGGVWLAIWLALYYLPVFIPILSRFYMGFFRLWMMLPQIGGFGIMLLLAMFSRQITLVIKLMKNPLVDEASSDQIAANASSNRTEDSGGRIETWRPIVMILTGLALVSYASYFASQR